MSKPATSTAQQFSSHESDAAWIMALWLAIHGGDPSPDEIAAEVIAVVAPYLVPTAPALSFTHVQERLTKLGVHLTRETISTDATRGQTRYCTRDEDGSLICLNFPPHKGPVEK